MFTSSSNMNTNFNMPWTSVNKNCKWQRKMNSYRTVWYTTHTALLSNTSKFSWKKKRWKKRTVSLKISPCTQVTLAHGDMWSRWENGCIRKSRSHRSETTTDNNEASANSPGAKWDWSWLHHQIRQQILCSIEWALLYRLSPESWLKYHGLWDAALQRKPTQMEQSTEQDCEERGDGASAQAALVLCV